MNIAHDVGAAVARVLAVIIIVVLGAVIVAAFFFTVAVADAAYGLVIVLLLALGHDVRDPCHHCPWQATCIRNPHRF